MNFDPYALLHTQENCQDKKQLKRAYGKLIKTYRPDEYPEEFGKIRQAYEAILAEIDQGISSATIETQPVRHTEECETGTLTNLPLESMSKLDDIESQDDTESINSLGQTLSPTPNTTHDIDYQPIIEKLSNNIAAVFSNDQDLNTLSQWRFLHQEPTLLDERVSYTLGKQIVELANKKIGENFRIEPDILLLWDSLFFYYDNANYWQIEEDMPLYYALDFCHHRYRPKASTLGAQYFSQEQLHQDFSANLGKYFLAATMAFAVILFFLVFR